MNYLVIDNGKNKLLSYAEQYQLFSDKEKAITHAKSIGFEDNFGLGVTDKVGHATVCMCGDVDVMIMPMQPK